jgi:hypothetical protein
VSSIQAPPLPPEIPHLTTPNVQVQDEGIAPSGNPFGELEIALGVILNASALSLALGWYGFFCIFPIMIILLLVLGNILKAKRQEYLMRNGVEATRHPVSTALNVIAIFSFLIGLFIGIFVNYTA